MALVSNIAGFDSMEVMPYSIGQTTPGDGLLSSVVQFTSSAAAGTGADPALAAIQQGINLLPKGELKTALQSDAWKGGLLGWIYTKLKGRTYTTGQYRLGERLIDQVIPTGSPNTATSYSQVSDEAVGQAILLFTILFGVRIVTQEDLDALQQGVSAYYQRPGIDWMGNNDIPEVAVQRAVHLKQTYYPDSLYNTAKWNLDYFSQFPLVAPIPDPLHYGQLYTGPLPGGGMATNGVILVDPSTPLSTVQQGTGTGTGGNSLLIIGAVLLLGAAAWYYNENK